MQSVYVLKSSLDGEFYIGCTSDTQKRLKEHNQGKVVSTRHRKPLKLVYEEAYSDAYEAFRQERFYKTANGKRELLRKMKQCGIV